MVARCRQLPARRLAQSVIGGTDSSGSGKFLQPRFMLLSHEFNISVQICRTDSEQLSRKRRDKIKKNRFLSVRRVLRKERCS